MCLFFFGLISYTVFGCGEFRGDGKHRKENAE